MTTPAQSRLDPDRLDSLPSSVRRPRYDRAATRLTLAHIGVGAFHRCHQADYLEDLLDGGHDDQALIGINLRPPHLGQLLGAQGCCYTRTLIDEDRHDTRLIGCIRHVIDAVDAPAAALAVLQDRRVTTITLTVTEKGYCHQPATGALDESHPGVLADIAGGAETVPGFLVRGLAARAAAGGGPVNLVSCDNISDNGRVLSGVTQAMARQIAPDLCNWIADNVAFPSTMVDRIAPAASPASLQSVAATIGRSDPAAVHGEMFRQWVIEDAFRAARPRWEAAGVEISASVTGHEQVKMRVLNAAQTLVALLGCLAGHRYSHQAVRDPVIADFVTRTLSDETLPLLPHVAGMEGAAYLTRALARIGNTGIDHQNRQIATDTSQKIRQRLLDPIRAARASVQDAPGLTCGVAAWIAWLARSAPAFGARWTISDPIMPRVAAILAANGPNLDGIAGDVIGLADVFGTDLSRDAGFRSQVAAHLHRLMSRPFADALRAAHAPDPGEGSA